MTSNVNMYQTVISHHLKCRHIRSNKGIENGHVDRN